MHFFIKIKNLEIVKFCLELGIDLSNEKLKPISYVDLAIENRAYDIVELLLTYGAKASESKIIEAAKHQNWKLQELIEKNSEVNFLVDKIKFLPESCQEKLESEAKRLGIWIPLIFK